MASWPGVRGRDRSRVWGSCPGRVLRLREPPMKSAGGMGLKLRSLGLDGSWGRWDSEASRMSRLFTKQGVQTVASVPVALSCAARCMRFLFAMGVG